MALDAVDTIKSTFGSLKTDAGMKVLGLLFVVQLLNMGSTYLASMGTGMMLVSVLISLVAAAAMILITVGAFRSFDSGEVNKDQYTSNIVWPLIRITGANAVTTIFAYGVALLALLPAILVGVLAGFGMSSAGVAGALTGSSILGAVLGIAGLVLAVAAFFYIFLMLTVSIPMIAAEDNRIFEALDRSVQRTKGEKASMFLAMLGMILVLVVALVAGVLLVGVLGLVSESLAGLVGIIGYILFSAVSSLVFLSLLNQYHQRLPE